MSFQEAFFLGLNADVGARVLYKIDSDGAVTPVTDALPYGYDYLYGTDNALSISGMNGGEAFALIDPTSLNITEKESAQWSPNPPGDDIFYIRVFGWNPGILTIDPATAERAFHPIDMADSIGLWDSTHHDGEIFASGSISYGDRELIIYDLSSDTYERVDIRGGFENRSGSLFPASSDPDSFYTYEGMVYFAAHDGKNGRELMRIDPSTRDIEVLTDLQPNDDSFQWGQFDYAEAFGKLFIYSHSTSELNAESLLFMLEGKNGNPVRAWGGEDRDLGIYQSIGGFEDVTYFTSSLGSSQHNSVSYIEYRGKLLFSAHVHPNEPGTPLEDKHKRIGNELFSIDPAGNVALVKDLDPRDEVNNFGGLLGASSDPSDFVEYKGLVYFSANGVDEDGNSAGRELWVTDGTAAGTRLFADIWKGDVYSPDSRGYIEASSNPAHLITVGDFLYFTASEANGDRELWRTDGTDSGTVKIDLVPGAASSDILNIVGRYEYQEPFAIPYSRRGGDSSETLQGTGEPDRFHGGGGNDTLIGNAAHSAFDPAAAQVVRLYQATLARWPDEAGHEGWTQKLLEGTPLIAIATGFVNSREFQATYGATSTTDFVTLLYENVLERAPDATGLAGWVSRLDGGQSRESVVVGFSESPEFQRKMAAEALEFSHAAKQADWSDDVFRLYQATLDRTPDTGGFASWTDQLAGGRAFQEVVTGFVQSREFQQTYGNTSNDDFIALLYRNVLGRDADAGGQAHWQGKLSGGWARERVVEGFSQSVEFSRDTAPNLHAWMRGSAQDDVLNGGPGHDILFGGLFADTFVFGFTDGGRDAAAGLETWDTLLLEGFDFATRAEAAAAFTQQGRDAVLDHANGQIRLVGVQADQLTEEQFVLG